MSLALHRNIMSLALHRNTLMTMPRYTVKTNKFMQTSPQASCPKKIQNPSCKLDLKNNPWMEKHLTIFIESEIEEE